MRDSTIVTHADVYNELPSTSTAANSVMMTADSSPTLQASLASTPNYVELPEEPRPGKISPSSNTSNSSPSLRASKSDAASLSQRNCNGGGSSSPELEEAIEEAVPIVRSTLPSPEPRPAVVEQRNGYGKEHLISNGGDKLDGDIKFKPPSQQRDVDDDSCLIKCVYFTQQCCECTIV